MLLSSVRSLRSSAPSEEGGPSSSPCGFDSAFFSSKVFLHCISVSHLCTYRTFRQTPARACTYTASWLITHSWKLRRHQRSSSSVGIIGSPSSCRHGGLGSPRCEAQSQRSIHSSSLWSMAEHLGCGSRASASGWFRTGRVLLLSVLGFSLSRMRSTCSSYPNSFATSDTT